MENQILNDIKKYITPKMPKSIIVFAVGAITILVLLLLTSVLGKELVKYLCIIIGIFTILSLLSIIANIISRAAINQQIKSLEESGELKNVLFDFQSAQPMYNDNIKLGKHYIFSRTCTLIVRYGDIDRVYFYEHSTNGIKDQRILKLKMKKGYHIELCNLKVYKNTKEDEEAVIDAILRRNPDIQLGYQP